VPTGADAALVPAPEPVAAASFHSTWVSQSANATIAHGTSATLSVRFRNTGTAAWVRGAPGKQANLAITSERSALTARSWLASDRVAGQAQAVVAPGEIATFNFEVRAPDSAGTYELHLRPVIDGTTWLEDDGVYFVVTSSAATDYVAAASEFLRQPANATLVFGAFAVILLLLFAVLARALLARARRNRYVHVTMRS
jgi:hypothetical protein